MVIRSKITAFCQKSKSLKNASFNNPRSYNFQIKRIVMLEYRNNYYLIVTKVDFETLILISSSTSRAI